MEFLNQRYSKANNKYLKNKYLTNVPKKYLMYLDCNNLYGDSLSRYLPFRNFEWIDSKSKSLN